MAKPDWKPSYAYWRHGGYYVDNVRYPNGAIGCVSGPDENGRWRVECAGGEDVTFPTRDTAARAEKVLVEHLRVLVAKGWLSAEANIYVEHP